MKKEQERVLNTKREKNKTSWWANLIAMGLLVLIFSSKASFPYQLGQMIGAFIFSWLCLLLARKIDKNINVAFLIGFIFTILGFLGYLIYYLIENKSRKRKEGKKYNR